MPHFTCAGSAPTCWQACSTRRTRGIDSILALRGDPPKGEAEFKPVPGGFRYAVDFIRFVRERGHFSLGAACYPESHVECPDKQLDWDRSAAKVEAGAEFLITQLFYNLDAYFEFADYLKNRRGVQVPIVPGVLPFLSADQIMRFTTLCGAKLPADLRTRIERLAHDDESVRQLGVEYCTEMCAKLLAAKVPGVHVYCLNRSASCRDLLRNLGLDHVAATGCRRAVRRIVSELPNFSDVDREAIDRDTPATLVRQPQSAKPASTPIPRTAGVLLGRCPAEPLSRPSRLPGRRRSGVMLLG